MTTQVDVGHTPVRVPLGVLQIITDAQVERLEVLLVGYKPINVTLLADSMMDGAILFTLFESRNGVIQSTLHGLIEPDGSCHT